MIAEKSMEERMSKSVLKLPVRCSLTSLYLTDKPIKTNILMRRGAKIQRHPLALPNPQSIQFQKCPNSPINFFSKIKLIQRVLMITNNLKLFRGFGQFPVQCVFVRMPLFGLRLERPLNSFWGSWGLDSQNIIVIFHIYVSVFDHKTKRKKNKQKKTKNKQIKWKIKNKRQ